MAIPRNSQRVKVYCLNEDGNWDDRGTGYISMDYMEQSEELGLYVIDEDDHETLLVHRISIEDIYRKREDTIISWRDSERSTELALSFQENVGCCYVWDQISNLQRNLNLNSLDNKKFQNVRNELRELPVVSLSTLPQIFKIVTESGMTDQMRLAELMLKDNDEFFQNLMKIFDICEASKFVKDLHMIFNIVRVIISFNNSQILQKIVGDKLFLKIIGCLEYDPDLRQPQRHRNYLKEHVVFKEAIPIKDPLVLSKIHQTFRIGYLKDVVMTKILDQKTSANLDSVMSANKATVLTSLKDDSTFFKELFERLHSPSTSVESRNDMVYFLHEFCSLSSKSLQKLNMLRFFRELIHNGIFEIIAEVLKSPDKKLVYTGTDIVFIFVTHHPNLLRSHVVQPEIPLLGVLVKGMMEDFGDAMESHFIEIFRILLDSNPLSGRAQVKIVDILFDKHLPKLVGFITASGRTKPELLLNICVLLCLCLKHDSFRKKFIQENVTEKVMLLTQRKEAPVVVAVIRVFRTLLSVIDDNVDSYVVENNLMKPIIDIFVANSKRDNLARSAVLELLEHIRKVNATVLIKYVVDTYWEQLGPFEHLTSIQSFKQTHEKCLESREPNEGAGLDNQVKEKEEEEEAGSSGSQSQRVKSGGLVDYEDDTDDDEEPPETSEQLRLKNKSPSRENEEEQSKKQKTNDSKEDDGSPSGMDVDGS